MNSPWIIGNQKVGYIKYLSNICLPNEFRNFESRTRLKIIQFKFLYGENKIMSYHIQLKRIIRKITYLNNFISMLVKCLRDGYSHVY